MRFQTVFAVSVWRKPRTRFGFWGRMLDRLDGWECVRGLRYPRLLVCYERFREAVCR